MKQKAIMVLSFSPKRRNVRIFLSILFCVLFFSLYSAESIDFILAKVGREIILFSDFVKYVNQMRNAQMFDDRMNEVDVLESMIENKLIVQKARELNIRVDERRITSMVDNQISQVRSSFSSEEDFQRELRNAGLILSDLRQYYEEMLIEQFLRDRLIQTEIRNRITVTDLDIQRFYQQEGESLPHREKSFELAMILRIPGASVETERMAFEQISNIKNLIDNGADFEDLAKQYSQCPSGQYGGDLGFFGRGMMVDEFEKTAFALDIGEVSEIIRTGFGYHILKLTDKRFNEVKSSHILIMVEESEEDIEREREFLNEKRERILSGESFSSMAIEYSHDENSKNNNGILGILTPSEFPPWFFDELNGLEVGQISEVLEYQNMLYLYTIYNEYEPRPFEFEEVKEQLRDIMLTNKQFELYENWISDLKKEIFVETFEDRLSGLE